MDDCASLPPLPPWSESAQTEDSLPVASIAESSADTQPTRRLKLRRVSRDRVTAVPARLEDLLPPDHLARLIWQAAERLDLSAFYAELSVQEGERGQAATDPLILVALWLYATSQGVTSARTLDKLCVEHLAYIWLCGGVSLNYHSLSDFRVKHGRALDALLTDVLAQLMQAGLVEFEQHAQDGMRVRASAGAASFHRRPTLEKTLAQAQALVSALESPSAATDEAPTARAQAAQERAAQERVERLEAALVELPAVQASKPAAERDEARVSSTDPDARVMKMADGGFRPAYNWQFAVDTAQRVITGVDVVNRGSDKAQLPPMVEQVAERCGQLPADWLMDGGFVDLDAMAGVSARGVRILAPVATPKDKSRDPHAPLPQDAPPIAAWRARMGTDEAKQTYKLRAATVECVNAQARTRYNVYQVRVRGRAKVLCSALWVAITHNLLLWLKHGAPSAPLACVA